MADAVNLCLDDGGPDPDRVCRRGHNSQALVSDERNGMVESLSLWRSGRMSCCLQSGSEKDLHDLVDLRDLQWIYVIYSGST